jgi:hypothetical protein
MNGWVSDYDQEQFEREHADEIQLELVCYGEGYAWLRKEDPRYELTDAGRRALAETWLFDHD